MTYNPGPGVVTYADLGLEFQLPEWAAYIGGRPTSCRCCSATVLFVRSLRTEKLAPLNPDGTSHFTTCPQAASWRRAPGTAAVTGASADVEPTAGMSRVLRPSTTGVGR